MTENEKEGAAKPQSDWDGDIIPRRSTIFLQQIKRLPTRHTNKHVRRMVFHTFPACGPILLNLGI